MQSQGLTALEKVSAQHELEDRQSRGTASDKVGNDIAKQEGKKIQGRSQKEECMLGTRPQSHLSTLLASWSAADMADVPACSGRVGMEQGQRRAMLASVQKYSDVTQNGNKGP